jgi:peroxiredoxin family protein
VTPSGADSRWVLLLRDGDEAALTDAAGMVAGAASLGIAVTVVWLAAALDALVSGQIEALEQEEAAAGRLLAAARETGRVRYLACSAASVRAGIANVREAVDEVVGWPTVVSLIRSSERAFVF